MVAARRPQEEEGESFWGMRCIILDDDAFFHLIELQFARGKSRVDHVSSSAGLIAPPGNRPILLLFFREEMEFDAAPDEPVRNEGGVWG